MPDILNLILNGESETGNVSIGIVPMKKLATEDTEVTEFFCFFSVNSVLSVAKIKELKI